MQRVVDWGTFGRDPGAEARAFAAAGVISARRLREGGVALERDDFYEILREAFAEDPVSWAVPAPGRSMQSAVDERDVFPLADAWAAAIDGAPRPPRIEIHDD